MAEIIAFANHKGGVGKTTSVANIGAAMAASGMAVLMVDLDAQQNLTGTFTNPDGCGATVYDALTGRAAAAPVVSVRRGLDIIPASIDLARADMDLAGRASKEGVLGGLLEGVAGRYDYVLLDCPPSLGVLTANALAAADTLYVPLTAEAYPLRGLAMIEEYVAMVGEGTGRGMAIDGIFFTRFNRRRINEAVAAEVSERYGARVFGTRVRECIALSEAQLCGQDILQYAPDSNGARDYTALASEMTARSLERMRMTNDKRKNDKR